MIDDADLPDGVERVTCREDGCTRSVIVLEDDDHDVACLPCRRWGVS